MITEPISTEGLPRAADSDWYQTVGTSLLHEEVAATLALGDRPQTPAELVETIGHTTPELIKLALDPLTTKGVIERRGAGRQLTEEGALLFAEHAMDKLLRVDAAVRGLGLDPNADFESPSRIAHDLLHTNLIHSRNRFHPNAVGEEALLAMALGFRLLHGQDPGYFISAYTGFDPSETLNTATRNLLVVKGTQKGPHGPKRVATIDFKDKGRHILGNYSLRRHTQLAAVVLRTAA
jgi:hypothetical protein